MLFFTAPPLNVSQPLTKDGRALGHSAAYLAARARREKARAEKRKADAMDNTEWVSAAKRAKHEDEVKLQEAVADLGTKAIKALEDQLASTTKSELQTFFNGKTKDEIEKVVDELLQRQAHAMAKNAERELHVQQWENEKRIAVTGMTARLEENI